MDHFQYEILLSFIKILVYDAHVIALLLFYSFELKTLWRIWLTLIYLLKSEIAVSKSSWIYFDYRIKIMGIFGFYTIVSPQ